MSDFRLDRAISLYVGRPFSLAANALMGLRIPILMYHSISDGLSHQHPYYETSTSPQVFQRQIRYLSENGYSTLTLGEALKSIAAGRVKQKSVVITFDDGFRDFYSEAYPVLLQYGYSATVFVVTNLAESATPQFKGKDCLTWSEIRDLRSHGIEIGSHTVSHPKLEFMEPAAIDYEIGQSKRILEDHLGEPIRSFAYPYAFPETNSTLTALLARTLEKHGYENGVTTILGTPRRRGNRFFLPRLPVNSWDDPCLFRAKLEGGYDWMHVPQSAYKKIRYASGIFSSAARKKAATGELGS